MKKIIFFLLVVCMQVSSAVSAQEQQYFPDPIHLFKNLEAWQDMKFGLLMHWGAYSQWGIVESWSICPEDLSWASGARKPGVAESYNDYVKKYEALQTTFNPTKFDPSKWADAAKEAGMKYLVFTTKHHDGFACSIPNTQTIKSPGRLVLFLPTHAATSLKKYSTRSGKTAFHRRIFFKPDWHSDYYWWKQFPAVDRNANYSIQKHPEQWKKFIDYTHGQINELMSDYGRLDILWLDGGWVRPTSDSEVKTTLAEIYENSRWARNTQNQDINMAGLVKEARAKQPGLIVVDRAVPGPYQNYLTPEQHIPETGLPYPWETCMTMGNSWSFVPNDVYKPADELIKKAGRYC